MKKLLSYPELWRKKQRELPLKGTADAGWQQMRSMLDNRMPVTGTIKKPFRLKLPKWGFHLLLGGVLVAAVYMGNRLYLSKQHQWATKPNTPQIQRPPVPPTATQASPAPDAVKPVTGSPVINPVTRGGDNRFTGKTKLNSDTVQKREQRTTDSISAPPVLNVPIRRDSLALPAEVIQQKAVHDSAGLVVPVKNNLQKDSSKNIKKPTKKKKRSKLSVFF